MSGSPDPEFRDSLNFTFFTVIHKKFYFGHFGFYHAFINFTNHNWSHLGEPFFRTILVLGFCELLVQLIFSFTTLGQPDQRNSICSDKNCSNLIIDFRLIHFNKNSNYKK
ncbi:hypothetical protein BpHYR1_003014 [Brachionus plicatilis]|uniref:Uncharacterized protein n=1 Tax=Brachionus plicatilis TaxID=10195 RepID=A0A3M7S5B5_BRAPC|nr:hypothetical protein BpHYR1_003014 [Brachionus plicatilis]